MSDLPFTVTRANGVALVGIRALTEFDHARIQQMYGELRPLVNGGTRGVVLDLDNVHFLSTQMVGAMLTLRREAEQAGVEVVLGRLRPELGRVFRIRQLDKLFSLFDTCEEAVRHFADKPSDETSAA